jgi:hypothetical protein
MGIDFNAVVSHHLTAEEVCQLPVQLTQCDALNSACDALEVVMRDRSWRRFRLRKPRWKANWRNFDVENVELAWSQGIECELERSPVHLYLSRSACTVWTMTRWRAFLSNDRTRDSLRRVCYELSILMAPTRRIPRAIYLPDSAVPGSNALELVEQGRLFEEALSWLREHCGPPPPTIASVDQDLGKGEQVSVGYFLDDFAEFRSG